MRLVVVLALAACQGDRAPQQNAGSGSGDDVCVEVVQRIRQALQPQIDAVGSNAKPTIVRMLPTMQTACTEDHWPPALTRCIVASKPGDLAAVESCNSMMPKDVQDKLQQRMLSLNPLVAP